MKLFGRWFSRNLFVGLLLATVAGTSGCVYLLIGGIGAVGGYIVSPDTVEGIVNREFVDVWDASMEIASIMGTIEEKYEQTGYIRAKISGARVEINVVKFTQRSIQLSVKARKALLPRISTAQDVFVKIMKYMDEEL